MTREEAIGILVCFAAVAIAGGWLIWSRIWGRRRIPERLPTCRFCGAIGCTRMECMTKAQDELNRAQSQRILQARRIRRKVDRLQGEVIEPLETVTEEQLRRATVMAFGQAAIFYPGSSHVEIYDGRRTFGEDAVRARSAFRWPDPPPGDGKPVRDGSGALRASFADFLGGGPHYMGRDDG